MARPDLVAAATARLEQAVAEWEAAGRPLLSKGSMGQEVEHPLSKLIRETEAHLFRLSGVAVRGGRPVGADSAPDRVPRVQLKAVGE